MVNFQIWNTIQAIIRRITKGASLGIRRSMGSDFHIHENLTRIFSNQKFTIFTSIGFLFGLILVIFLFADSMWNIAGSITHYTSLFIAFILGAVFIVALKFMSFLSRVRQIVGIRGESPEKNIRELAELLEALFDAVHERDVQAVGWIVRAIIRKSVASYTDILLRKLFLTSVLSTVAVFGGIFGTALLFRQISLLIEQNTNSRIQNELISLQNRKIDLQIVTSEAQRRSFLFTELNSIAQALSLGDGISVGRDASLRSGVSKGVSVRIANLSRSAKPYHTVSISERGDHTDITVSKSPKSQERGDLLLLIIQYISPASVKNAVFEYSDLRDQFLEDADLSNLLLSHSDFGRAKISRANFSESILKESVLTRADAREADFSKANLAEANLEGGWFGDSNFSESNLREAKLNGANFSKANLRNAVLIAADMRRVILSNANLRGANLSFSNLQGSILTNLNAEWSNITGADLSGVDLKYSILDGSVLSGSDFSRSNLSQAAIRKAILTGAKFTGADLSGADLTGTDLSNVEISTANLDGAILSTAQDLGIYGGSISLPEVISSEWRMSEELGVLRLRNKGPVSQLKEKNLGRYIPDRVK